MALIDHATAIDHTALLALSILLVAAAVAMLTLLMHERTEKIMTKLSDLQTAEADLEGKVDSLLTYASHQQTHIAELDAEIASLKASGIGTDALQSIADAMRAKGALVTAFLAPPAAPPVADPAPSPGGAPPPGVPALPAT